MTYPPIIMIGWKLSTTAMEYFRITGEPYSAVESKKKKARRTPVHRNLETIYVPNGCELIVERKSNDCTDDEVTYYLSLCTSLGVLEILSMNKLLKNNDLRQNALNWIRDTIGDTSVTNDELKIYSIEQS